jgi:hypothetical protein
MGTSTRWEGPGGDRWRAAGGRPARWRPDQRNADQRLEEIAGDHLHALHETMRADSSAFSLHDAACTAGERLADVMGSLAKAAPKSTDEFLTLLTEEVGGDGGTLTDAALRRGAAAAGREVLELHPELDDEMRTGSSGFASDILCDLYQLFFADVVSEFLRSVIAEHVNLAVPVLIATDPEGRIAGWVAEQVLTLVPSPCEEAAAVTGPEAVDTAEAGMGYAQDPGSALPEIARRLVPRTVGRVLGLITEEAVAETLKDGEAAA